MKITIPLIEVVSTGSLRDFYDDLIKIQSGLTISNDGINVYIENGNTINLSLGQVSQILAVGGQVEQYLLAIQADIAMLSDELPIGLPNEKTYDGTGVQIQRQFKDWFDTSAEVYKKDDNTKIYFVTNPIGTTREKYLTGTEIALIYNSFKASAPLIINRNCIVKIISQFQADIVSGWTKI